MRLSNTKIKNEVFVFCNAFAFHYIREMKNRTIKNKKSRNYVE